MARTKLLNSLKLVCTFLCVIVMVCCSSEAKAAEDQQAKVKELLDRAMTLRDTWPSYSYTTETKSSFQAGSVAQSMVSTKHWVLNSLGEKYYKGTELFSVVTSRIGITAITTPKFNYLLTPSQRFVGSYSLEHVYIKGKSPLSDELLSYYFNPEWHSSSRYKLTIGSEREYEIHEFPDKKVIDRFFSYLPFAKGVNWDPKFIKSRSINLILIRIDKATGMVSLVEHYGENGDLWNTMRSFDFDMNAKLTKKDFQLPPGAAVVGAKELGELMKLEEKYNEKK